MHIKHLSALAVLALLPWALAAQRPIPGATQSAPILVLGATAHLGNGKVIPNSAIAFDHGKITLVADATTLRFDRSKYGKIYDAAGKHLYPGFIAPDTRIGLVEIDMAKPTRDFADVGTFNPELRTLVAYNTDSEVIPTIRSNGILLAQAAPEGGLLSGTSSVMQLDAWNWEDAAFRADDGVWLNWPSLRRFGNRVNESYDKEVEALRRFFEEAKAYNLGAPETKNLKLQAMKGLFTGEQALFIRASTAKTIQDAVLFAESFGVKPVLTEPEDAWVVADFLSSHKVPVILGPTQSLPARDDDAVDQTFKTAKQLYDKGVLFAFSSEGGWRQRNLPFQAGQACGFGLPKEAALSAITLNTAKILGIDQRCGSLEVGKDATLFIAEGDALDMRTCIVTAAFIQGREINLDNKQKALARRFEAKYRQ